MNKKSLLLAGVAAFALTSAATAADLMVEAPPAMVYDEPAPAGNWDGPYIGAFGGWGMGFADHTNATGGSPCVGQGIPAGADGCDLFMDGWLVGVVAGANFHLSDEVIGGVAADIAWTDISGTDDFPPPVDESSNRVNWEGSIRGVLGYDGGVFMPYLTAGLAVANASHISDAGATTVNMTHLGATAGAGAQVAVSDNVALDLQYRVSVYGEKEYDSGAPFPPPAFALVTHRITAGINVGF